jgi:SAM-dependent methyltransferase
VWTQCFFIARVRINGMNDLPTWAFSRDDESADERFYAVPRFVTHIDDGAIAAVTGLYREFFPANGAILDLMSSWVSHLPEDVSYSSVTGVGMNGAELNANPRLTARVVQNLNQNPALPFSDSSFDGAGICVSVDYLTDPVRVLEEVNRVLKPGAPLVVTFSNRCFPTKVIRAWLMLDDAGRVELVRGFLEAAGFEDVQTLDRSPKRGDPLYTVIGRASS